jgi:hypothetical protein
MFKPFVLPYLLTKAIFGSMWKVLHCCENWLEMNKFDELRYLYALIYILGNQSLLIFSYFTIR